ncbi:MAG: NFACT family protein [Firmicutes bacterium]|nr:NFACT family protein [Bacillota bacterium]
MSFDGIVTGAVARQLHRCLTGARIEKIYQPEGDEIVLHCHAGREKYKLYLSSNSAHCRVHLTKGADSNPPNPSAFCMLLRKHLQGGRIASVEQKDSERILEISVDTVNELGFAVNKKLIAEIMGKHSNIVLVDLNSGKIVDCIKRISIDVNRYRQLLPGLPYVYPPSQNKRNAYTLTEESFCQALIDKEPLNAKALVGAVCGISPTFAEEVCFRASNGSEAPLSASQVWPVFHRMVEQILAEDCQSAVYVDPQRGPVEFHAIPLLSYAGSQQFLFDDISTACDYYYGHKSSSNRVRQKTNDLTKTVEAMLQKLCLKKKRLSEDLLSAENSESYRLYGELLMANLHLVQPGMEQVTVLNYYDNTQLTIPLDKKLSPSRNSQRYFKLYGKSKTAIKEKQVQLEETQQDLDYLESVASFIERAETFEAVEAIRQELTELGYLKKRKQSGKPVRMKLKPYEYMTSDGFRISAGHNNRENDELTFKLADKKDLWFHTKDIPGSHVILHTDGRQATETALFEAAAIAAFHSKGRDSENVPVDYVSIRYVKKPNGAKPGMVIFTNNRTLYVNPALPSRSSDQKTE